MYKSVFNDNYLCHYNQNHSKKNGQFVSGDGDGDGISNDHANQRKKIKGDISKGTWKNNAGVNLKYVSPKGLKPGYWINADTGKKASAGNQWRQVPKEFRKREAGKSMFYTGLAVATAVTIQAGMDIAEYCMDRKINNWNRSDDSVERARQYVDDFKRARAAKIVGGDW